jgi:predicted nucleic acid-binding protein
MGGLTLDAGALIAFDRNERAMVALIHRAVEQSVTICVPATALAQVVRRPDRQARLSRLTRQKETEVVALDDVDARLVGRLLAVTGTADIVDAHVVVCAQRNGHDVVTSDPGDLRVLDPALLIHTV